MAKLKFKNKLIYIFMLIPVVLLSLSACEIKLEITEEQINEVKTEFSKLLEASYEVNELLFGKGPSTYAKDSEYAIANNLYPNNSLTNYLYVTKEEKYQSIAQIKEVSEKVYSSAYLTEVYISVFDGHFIEGVGNVPAKYTENEIGLSVYVSESDKVLNERQYDLETIVFQDYNELATTFTVDTYLNVDGEKQSQINVKIRMLKENGVWKLDAPTY